jgi:hypothetical protein
MHTRRWRCPLLAGALATVALLSLGATNTATAQTLDLAAIFTSDQCAADGAELAFMDMEATTPAPNTPRRCVSRATAGLHGNRVAGEGDQDT